MKPNAPRVAAIAAACALLAGACASPTDSVGAAGADITAAAPAPASLDVREVNAAIAKLDEQRTKAPIAPFQDETRIEGCWINPAANKPCKKGDTCAPWSDLKKSFYCKQPLEFRICSSTVLLNTDESAVDQRVQGYRDCQQKVDKLFGGKGLFVYDEQVAAVWKQIIVDGATLSPDDQASVVAANKPTLTGRSFPIVLAAIVHGLGVEVLELSLGGMKAMVDDLVKAGGENMEAATDAPATDAAEPPATRTDGSGD